MKEFFAAVATVVAVITAVGSFISLRRSTRFNQKKEDLDLLKLISEQCKEIGPGRDALLKVKEKLKEDFKDSFVDSIENTSKNKELVDWYKKKFHEAHSDSKERKLCTKIREYIDQLDRWGRMLSDGKIRRDRLFKEIGSALKIDLQSLPIIVQAHRNAHDDPKLWENFDVLVSEFEKWKKEKTKCRA